MKRNSTIQDIQILMSRIGCYSTAMIESHLHSKYPTFNKPGDPAILLKHDANTMVYSPADVRE